MLVWSGLPGLVIDMLVQRQLVNLSCIIAIIINSKVHLGQNAITSTTFYPLEVGQNLTW
jgi:hypothetical protein